MTPAFLRPAMLNGFATICVIAACVLFVWPPSSVSDAGSARAPVPLATTPSPALTTGGGSATDSLEAVVVAGNIFSATRQPPRTRFVPPGQAALVAETMNGAMDSASTMSQASLVDSLPRLTGIVTTNGERRALVQFALADGAPQLYAVGDARGGFRVLRIESDKVVVATRSGSRTLRLSPRTPPDSLDKQP